MGEFIVACAQLVVCALIVGIALALLTAVVITIIALIAETIKYYKGKGKK